MQHSWNEAAHSAGIECDVTQDFKILSSYYEAMKTEYDLSKMESRKNPYATKLKKLVTMRSSEDVVADFPQKTVGTFRGLEGETLSRTVQK